MPKQQSAGILLYKQTASGPQVLLIKHGGPFWTKKMYGAWSIPKGGIEEGESRVEAARREFSEETGTPAPDDAGFDLGQIEQRNNKTVYAWAIEGGFDPATFKSNTYELEWPPKSGKVQQFPEVERAEWLGLEEASRRINPDQVPFLARLAEHLGVDFQPASEPQQNTLF